jgi:hypothetical protein
MWRLQQIRGSLILERGAHAVPAERRSNDAGDSPDFSSSEFC